MTAEEKANLLKWDIDTQEYSQEKNGFIEIMEKYEKLRDDDIDILFRYGYNISSKLFET